MLSITTATATALTLALVTAKARVHVLLLATATVAVLIWITTVNKLRNVNAGLLHSWVEVHQEFDEANTELGIRKDLGMLEATAAELER